MLRRYFREDGSAPWQAAGPDVPVLLGKNGLAWAWPGNAVYDHRAPEKVEGDRRSPAGIFKLTKVFGQSRLGQVHMPALTITATTEAVDDPRSAYYDEILERQAIAKPDWKSSEHMGHIPDYALGVIVEANPERVRLRGSCIFLHLWIRQRGGTLGCTALPPKAMEALVHWLDASQNPVLIQAPAGELPKLAPGIPWNP